MAFAGRGAQLTNFTADELEQSELLGVGGAHDGRLAPHCLEGGDIVEIADAPGRHNGNAGPTQHFVKREVGSTHGAVSIDGGGVNSRDTSLETTSNGVQRSQARRIEPALGGDASILDVDRDDESVT